MPALLSPWLKSSNQLFLPLLNVGSPDVPGLHQVGTAGGSAPSGVSQKTLIGCPTTMPSRVPAPAPVAGTEELGLPDAVRCSFLWSLAVRSWSLHAPSSAISSIAASSLLLRIIPVSFARSLWSESCPPPNVAC